MTNKKEHFLRPDQLYLTDGGLETTLVFHHGIELPHFAAFHLLSDIRYDAIFEQYYQDYIDLAEQFGTGFILEAATWRANTDWGYKLGYSPDELFALNQGAIVHLHRLRQNRETANLPILISGCIGPRGDGYIPGERMDILEAANYHLPQIQAFSMAGADCCSAMTINYVEEAIGIAAAAHTVGLPVVISFTLEIDGCLPDGESLGRAIEIVDAQTSGYPAYYMVNCAHPSHFMSQLKTNEAWLQRIMGVRANASLKSHYELDEATELDTGNKLELAQRYQQLRERLPNLQVLGGCCGTDCSHIETICSHWFGQEAHVH